MKKVVFFTSLLATRGKYVVISSMSKKIFSSLIQFDLNKAFLNSDF